MYGIQGVLDLRSYRHPGVEVGSVEVRWLELPLPYDHGEVRCWHGACYCKESDELIVHSGMTQVRRF